MSSALTAYVLNVSSCLPYKRRADFQIQLHFLSGFLETVVAGITEYELKILQNLIMFLVIITYNVNV